MKWVPCRAWVIRQIRHANMDGRWPSPQAAGGCGSGFAPGGSACLSFGGLLVDVTADRGATRHARHTRASHQMQGQGTSKALALFFSLAASSTGRLNGSNKCSPSAHLSPSSHPCNTHVLKFEFNLLAILTFNLAPALFAPKGSSQEGQSQGEPHRPSPISRVAICLASSLFASRLTSKSSRYSFFPLSFFSFSPLHSSSFSSTT